MMSLCRIVSGRIIGSRTRVVTTTISPLKSRFAGDVTMSSVIEL